MGLIRRCPDRQPVSVPRSECELCWVNMFGWVGTAKLARKNRGKIAVKVAISGHRRRGRGGSRSVDMGLRDKVFGQIGVFFLRNVVSRAPVVA